MATRKANPTVKATIAAAQHTDQVNDRAAIHAAIDELLDSKPLGRMVFETSLHILMGLGLGTIVRFVVMYVAFSALVLTGSMFLATLIQILGTVIGIATAITVVYRNNVMLNDMMSSVADKVYDPSANFVATKYEALKDWVATKRLERQLNTARTVH